MDFIKHLVAYFKKNKKPVSPADGKIATIPKNGTYPVCWGRQEYDGKLRKLYKDKQIDVNHHTSSYLKSKKFVVEHIVGIHFKKAEISECPECGKNR